MSLSTYCPLDRFVSEIQTAGFAISANVVSDEMLSSVVAELQHLSTHQSSRRGQVYAARNLLATANSVVELATSPNIRTLVESTLGVDAFPVRALLFDKVPGANWNVSWHQDQVIPVAEQREVAGFSAWSVKRGVPHVRPPAAVLERMLTLRVHIDNCNCNNGALQVIPGSHRHGILSDKDIKSIVAGSNPTLCETTRGSVLAMRPLLLHSSPPAVSPAHRRVIHIEFAVEPLPNGLKWADWSRL